MIFWKWSNGTLNLKSSIKENIKCDIEEIQPTKEMNNREQISNSLNERDPLFQTNINPFFSSQTYIEDIQNRDTYLKPINTSKIKNNK